MNANGDTAPRGLANAMKIMRGEVKRIQKAAHRQRKASYLMAPRQFCTLCLATFDEAIVPPDSQPTATLCKDCKDKLAKGYTVVQCVGKPSLFLLSRQWQEAGYGGKILTLAPDQFAVLEEKIKQEGTDVPEQKPPLTP